MRKLGWFQIILGCVLLLVSLVVFFQASDFVAAESMEGSYFAGLHVSETFGDFLFGDYSVKDVEYAREKSNITLTRADELVEAKNHLLHMNTSKNIYFSTVILFSTQMFILFVLGLFMISEGLAKLKQN